VLGTFFTRVREEVRAQGLKLGDFERSIGVSVGYFSRTQRHNSTPSLLIALEISKTLGVSLDYLCGGDKT